MEQAEKKPTTLTGVDLSQTASLLLPWTHDPWGKLRPPLSEEALCMSAELASAAYGMAIEPWVEAGWRDVTIQVDGELTALPPNNPLSAEWRKYWVRARLKPVSPLGQMLGALRLSSSNNTTGKAVVMLHPALDGRYVVAIGFMGTGSRFYDWFSNFRMTTQDGMHRGFLELARQFEANEEKISFPETAEELGLEKLTLRDILQNMRSPNSRFVLWVCGHSQGAAMMQVYAHLKMNETGISARNLIGYGFASPTVMAGKAVRDPSAYPLYNILNSDDLVPHCGAAVHLGMCLKYQATENLRKSCYNWKRDEKSVQARLAIRPVLWKMVDTPTCIIGGMALLMALGRVSGADFLKMLGLGGFLPLDRALEKTSHKPLLPSVAGISKFVTKHYKVLFVVLIVLCIPAFYGYNNVGKYYDMSACLPQELESVKANTKLSETFDVSTNHLVLVDADVPQKDVVAMTDEMAEVDGVKQVLSIDSLLGAGIPESIVPDEILSELKSDEYQLMLISSEYIISSDAVNRQIDELNEILKKYDDGGMLIGEAPCTKDLISCTDHDFEVVSLISIIAIFLIIALVLRSISLPVILVAVIETAIAANLCIPYYTNVTLPFVAPILISTIQLGSTVDYAILMTTRYLQNRRAGADKREAVSKAVASSAQSILVSGIGFFAATFGVGLYSNVDIISSMCSLMARGALCSVVVVLFLLPAVLLVLDKVIIHTTLKMNVKN